MLCIVAESINVIWNKNARLDSRIAHALLLTSDIIQYDRNNFTQSIATYGVALPMWYDMNVMKHTPIHRNMTKRDAP